MVIRILNAMILFLAVATRFAPLNSVRVAALRAMPNTRVGDRVRIDFGCSIRVDWIEIEDDVQIGRFNRFAGPVRISIGARTKIGARNTFGCADWVRASRYVEQGYVRSLELGAECLVTDDHFFDCAGLVKIGDGTWFAGKGSQVWTHGVGIAERDVVIGSRCYLGSAVRLSPGARLGDDCILSLGSVLTSDLSEVCGSMVAGAPAKPIKQLEADYAAGRIERHRANWR